MSNDAQRNTSMPFTKVSHGDGTIRILRLPAVINRVGLCRSSIYNRQRAGDFPPAVKLGPRAVGFVEDEIDAWLQAACGRREGAGA
ncbi:AlpA family transcriptional regulator [Variovorax sp. YR752]|uniref:AlpA family transcriptional regulator n=1 Tax=Variovorax sp. YR752 TaxID=1884383 RepID=UPI0031383DA8